MKIQVSVHFGVPFFLAPEWIPRFRFPGHSRLWMVSNIRLSLASSIRYRPVPQVDFHKPNPAMQTNASFQSYPLPRKTMAFGSRVVSLCVSGTRTFALSWFSRFSALSFYSAFSAAAPRWALLSRAAAVAFSGLSVGLVPCRIATLLSFTTWISAASVELSGLSAQPKTRFPTAGSVCLLGQWIRDD